MTPCFLLEPNGSTRVWLRVYDAPDPADSESLCLGRLHEALVLLGDYGPDDTIPDSAPIWPASCDLCGTWFEPDAEHQVFRLSLYSVTEAVDDCQPIGAVFHTHSNEAFEGGAPPGAMWDATWLHGRTDQWDPANPWWLFGAGEDGRVLTVRVPGRHDWIVDARASNCTLPGDNDHRCWVREGDAPFVTVGKNGRTCEAGQGSIAIGDYHGFLQNGYLT